MQNNSIQPVPIFAPGIIGEILKAIVANAARDRKQALQK